MKNVEQFCNYPIMPAKWVRPALIPALFGLTIEAANANRKKGVWLENLHWKKDKQNNIIYNWRAIEDWYNQ